jgi:hypothetical protein
MNEPVYQLAIMLVRGLALLIIGLGIYAGLRKRSATAQNDFWRLVHVGTRRRSVHRIAPKCLES